MENRGGHVCAHRDPGSPHEHRNTQRCAGRGVGRPPRALCSRVFSALPDVGLPSDVSSRRQEFTSQPQSADAGREGKGKAYASRHLHGKVGSGCWLQSGEGKHPSSRAGRTDLGGQPCPGQRGSRGSEGGARGAGAGCPQQEAEAWLGRYSPESQTQDGDGQEGSPLGQEGSPGGSRGQLWGGEEPCQARPGKGEPDVPLSLFPSRQHAI